MKKYQSPETSHIVLELVAPVLQAVSLIDVTVEGKPSGDVGGHDYN